MNKFILKTLALALIIATVGCTKEDPTPNPKPTPEVKLNNPVNDFVWKAMNSWYKWQDEIPNLADDKAKDKNSYYSYLNSYSQPKALFESVLHNKSVDRFSWFIEDYIEQEKQFEGVYVTTGIRRSNLIQTKNNNVIIYAQYVTKGSPADVAGIKRGDIIYAIDGIESNVNNYREVLNKLYSGKTIVISIANVDENDVLTKKADFTITPAEVSDNPVYLSKVFENINGKRVGYLVYNGFRGSYDKFLNTTFAELKTKNIDELILDFRANGGGSVLTCAYLASMIYGEGTANKDVFAKTVFNKKHPKSGYSLPFLNGIWQYDDNGKYIDGGDIPLNRLTGLSKVYIITTSSTASASEMIINGLRPYIEVITVGTTTAGKNVGSHTLYDNPGNDFRGKKGINTAHKYAMQPITFKIYNAQNQSDYVTGFKPNIEAEGWKNWKNILPFGDENEVLLKATLNKIRGTVARPYANTIDDSSKMINDRGIKSDLKFEKEMYFDSNFINNLSK